MTKNLNQLAFNAYQLKMIALITMCIDHIARVIFPELYILKVIGRIAFVLYSFLLVEGFVHTKSTSKYLFRLILFALLSEIPYDLAFGNMWYDPFRQNIFFTLSAGLISLLIIDSNKVSSDHKVLLIASIVTAANLFHFDYYYLGVLQVIFLYVFRNNNVKKFLTVGILNLFFMFKIAIQSAAIMAFVPIYYYNGEKGRKTGLFYYAFYPVHLLVFWLIKRYGIG